MTLATGSKPLLSSREGFSLIEILLVVALIALASGVLITNFTTFSDVTQEYRPEEILQAAIREARFTAAAERVTTRISYDDKTGNLLIEPGDQSYGLGENFGTGGQGEIRFYLVPPAEGLRPFPDADRSTLKTREVAFAPDRSSSPFIAEIDNGLGNALRLRFDPFSSVVRTDK
ncbi:MAG: type II secretion system protein [Verrucomicrobiota bacterium]